MRFSIVFVTLLQIWSVQGECDAKCAAKVASETGSLAKEAEATRFRVQETQTNLDQVKSDLKTCKDELNSVGNVAQDSTLSDDIQKTKKVVGKVDEIQKEIKLLHSESTKFKEQFDQKTKSTNDHIASLSEEVKQFKLKSERAQAELIEAQDEGKLSPYEHEMKRLRNNNRTS